MARCCWYQAALSAYMPFFLFQGFILRPSFPLCFLFLTLFHPLSHFTPLPTLSSLCFCALWWASQKLGVMQRQDFILQQVLLG